MSGTPNGVQFTVTASTRTPRPATTSSSSRSPGHRRLPRRPFPARGDRRRRAHARRPAADGDHAPRTPSSPVSVGTFIDGNPDAPDVRLHVRHHQLGRRHPANRRHGRGHLDRRDVQRHRHPHLRGLPASTAASATYPITINVYDVDGSSTTITNTANVADVPLTVTGKLNPASNSGTVQLGQHHQRRPAQLLRHDQPAGRDGQPLRHSRPAARHRFLIGQGVSDASDWLEHHREPGAGRRRLTSSPPSPRTPPAIRSSSTTTIVPDLVIDTVGPKVTERRVQPVPGPDRGHLPGLRRTEQRRRRTQRVEPDRRQQLPARHGAPPARREVPDERHLGRPGHDQRDADRHSVDQQGPLHQGRLVLLHGLLGQPGQDRAASGTSPATRSTASSTATSPRGTRSTAATSSPSSPRSINTIFAPSTVVGRAHAGQPSGDEAGQGYRARDGQPEQAAAFERGAATTSTRPPSRRPHEARPSFEPGAEPPDPAGRQPRRLQPRPRPRRAASPPPWGPSAPSTRPWTSSAGPSTTSRDMADVASADPLAAPGRHLWPRPLRYVRVWDGRLLPRFGDQSTRPNLSYRRKAHRPMAEEPEPNFEDALTRIERIVADLERGEPALNTALAKYEDGVKLLRRCYDLLDQAERLRRPPDRSRRAGQPRHRPLRRHRYPLARARIVHRPRPYRTRNPGASIVNPVPVPGPPRMIRPRSPTLRFDPNGDPAACRPMLEPSKNDPSPESLNEIGLPSFPTQSLHSMAKSQASGATGRNTPIQSAQPNFVSQSFRGSHVDFRERKVHNTLAFLVVRGGRPVGAFVPRWMWGRCPAISTRLWHDDDGDHDEFCDASDRAGGVG